MGYWKFLDTASAEKDFEDDYNVIVQNAFGVGMPPHHNVITPFGLVDGGVFQRTIIPPRVFTLQCATKTTTIDAWHTAREDLFDQLKRDRAGTVSPVTIRYDDGTTTLDIAAYYDGGLEIGTLEKTIEKFAIRFVCADPFWKASSTSSTSLNVVSTITNEAFVYRDSTGLWNSDGPAVTASARIAFAEKSNGNIIVAGHNENIYEWNGSTFSDIGTITSSTDVHDVIVDASDNVIIVGSFTDVDAVTARRIAKWNGSAWSEPATNGLNDIIYSIAIDTSGNYVIGGNFTADGTAAGTYRRIATVNASTGAIAEVDSGVDAICYAVAVDVDNNYFFGGAFVTSGPGGPSLDKLLKWDGTTMTELTPAANSSVRSLAYDANRNTIYAGGQFTAYDSPAITINYLIKVENDLVTNLAGNNQIHDESISLDSNKTIFYIDQVSDYLRSKRGTTDVVEGIKCSGDGYGLFIDSSDRVWFGNDDGAQTWTVAGRTTVNNTGTAEAFPTIAITGPGQLWQLRNYSNNKTIYFDGTTLQTDEVVTIDLSPGVKTVTSSIRGNFMSHVEPPSDLASFSLLPGNNNISLWVDDASASATITWTATYWSIDGVT